MTLNYEDFAKWINENDFFFKNFIIIKDIVFNYLSQRKDDEKWCSNVIANFNNVLQNCDSITYDEEGVPEAYLILHFLDRYHRFQLIYMEMLKEGCFPLASKLNMIDIGTGTGPSMFAYSDMVELIQRYKSEINCSETIESICIDYAEQSEGFRQQIHMISEYLVLRKKCYVPFHFGTYKDAFEMKFNGKILRDAKFIKFASKRYYIPAIHAKRSFNSVIYSNFLTNKETIELYATHIRNAMFYMKNRGVLIFVGANPESEKYKPVYQLLEQYMMNTNYNTNKYNGCCKKIIPPTKMHIKGNDRFIIELKKFYTNILNLITHDDWNKLDSNFKRQITSYIDSTNDKTWYLTVYQRLSSYKHHK